MLKADHLGPLKSPARLIRSWLRAARSWLQPVRRWSRRRTLTARIALEASRYRASLRWAGLGEEARRFFQPTALRRDMLASSDLPDSDRDNRLYREFLENTSGDIHKLHHYFPIYERHFRQFVGKRPNVFEIGVQRGGSARLWRNYFGDGVRVTGIDIDPHVASLRPGEGVKFEIGSQADPDFLRQMTERHGPFDVIIDDGGHTAEQQICSLISLFPKLLPGGVYLVEDVQTSYFEDFESLPGGVTFMDFARMLCGRLYEAHFAGRSSHDRFLREFAARHGELVVSEFCATCWSISFYDSIVCFEKVSRKKEPLIERR